jgi:hypothetical protein
MRRTQQVQRGGFVVGRQHRRRLGLLAVLRDQFVLQRFKFQQHVADIALDRLVGQAEFYGGLAHVRGAGARGVQIQRVDVVARSVQMLAPHLQVHTHLLGRQVFLPAADAPRAVAQVQQQLVAGGRQLDIGHVGG